MSPRKNTQSVEYKSVGTFHWKHFTEKGNWHPGVNSTAPRLDFMQSEGGIKEFVDDKKQTKFNVIFDAEYVFEYLYQKIIVNMGWENDGKIDNEVLGYFLKDFAEYCGAVEQRKQLAKLRQQAKELSGTFPNKTVEEWEEVLLGQLQPNKISSVEVEQEEDNGEWIQAAWDADQPQRDDVEQEHDNIHNFDYDLQDIGDEKANILVTENEALGNETERTEEITVSIENEENATIPVKSIEVEENNNAEIETTKDTTEDVTPIVPVVEPRRRGRPKKSLLPLV